MKERTEWEFWNWCGNHPNNWSNEKGEVEFWSSSDLRWVNFGYRPISNWRGSRSLDNYGKILGDLDEREN